MDVYSKELANEKKRMEEDNLNLDRNEYKS